MSRPNPKGHLLAVILAVLSCLLNLVQSEFHCNNGTLIENNPLGTCVCDQHLWIGHRCEEGFWCQDTSGYGCHIVSSICYAGLGLSSVTNYKL